jgi:hypothetical protein
MKKGGNHMSLTVKLDRGQLALAIVLFLHS